MAGKRLMHVALVKPQIGWNTGNVGRTCLAFGAALHIIDPAFSMDEKSVRRAGLDYWKDVDVKMYDSWDEFDERTRKEIPRRFFFSTKGDKTLDDTQFMPPSMHKSDADGGADHECTALVFGAETAGLYELIGADAMEGSPVVRIPMTDATRSLNLSTTAGMVLWEVWRQQLVAGRHGP